MANSPNPTTVKATAALAGVISLLVLIQAVTGGLVARESNRKGVVNGHSGIAYLVAVLAVGLVVVAVAMWRDRAGYQVVIGESVALLVCVIIQIGIGMKIGNLPVKGGDHPGLLAIHIPLALIIFGLTLHLQTYVTNLRRQA
ncbi:MAG: hypothetical protein ACRDZ8_07450 [Acidimicrobiales bacterium]